MGFTKNNSRLFKINVIIFIAFFILLAVIGYVYAGIWTPPAQVNLRDRYNLENATNVTASSLCIYNSTGEDCRAEWPAHKDDRKGAGIYLYNDTESIYVNETQLNNTIAGRSKNDTDDTYAYNQSTGSFNQYGTWWYNQTLSAYNWILGNNNVFTGSLNTFGNIIGQQIYGVYNWTTSSGFLSFDGDTLSFDSEELNSTISQMGNMSGFLTNDSHANFTGLEVQESLVDLNYVNFFECTFFTDNNNYAVGIGKCNPGYALDVVGEIRATDSITSSNVITGNTVNSAGNINALNGNIRGQTMTADNGITVENRNITQELDEINESYQLINTLNNSGFYNSYQVNASGFLTNSSWINVTGLEVNNGLSSYVNLMECGFYIDNNVRAIGLNKCTPTDVYDVLLDIAGDVYSSGDIHSVTSQADKYILVENRNITAELDIKKDSFINGSSQLLVNTSNVTLGYVADFNGNVNITGQVFIKGNSTFNDTIYLKKHQQSGYTNLGLAFVGDEDTGITQISTNQFQFVAGGALSFSAKSSILEFWNWRAAASNQPLGVIGAVASDTNTVPSFFITDESSRGGANDTILEIYNDFSAGTRTGKTSKHKFYAQGEAWISNWTAIGTTRGFGYEAGTMLYVNGTTKVMNDLYVEGTNITGVLDAILANTTNSTDTDGFLTSVASNSTAYIGNISINETGVYTFGNKLSPRTADVVVCRGTSAADDAIKMAQCDVVCKSDDSDCTAELQSSFINGKRTLIMSGEYNVTAPIMLRSNSIIEGNNATLFTAGKEQAWKTGLGTRSGILNGARVSPNSGLVENFTIRNIDFVYNDLTIGIALFGGKNINIEDNTFTGNPNATAVSSGIEFDGIYGTATLSNLNIKNNRFENIRTGNCGGIIFFDNRGYEANNVNIINNIFEDYNCVAIQITGSQTMIRNVKIIGNSFIEANDTSEAGGMGDYAEAMNIGLLGGYVEDFIITNNYYRNGFKFTPAMGEAGFIFTYQGKNFKISDNIAIMNISLNQSINSLAFAPGRVTAPIRGYTLSNNQVDGFMFFIDPDSMVDAEIYGNVITNTGGIFPILGYGLQENVHIHDNIITNRNNSQFGNATDGIYAIMELANSNPINSVIENNIITDLSDNTRIDCGLQMTGTYNYQNVSIKNNRVYIKSNSTYKKICNQTASNVKPSEIYGNNFLEDSIKDQYFNNVTVQNLTVNGIFSPRDKGVSSNGLIYYFSGDNTYNYAGNANATYSGSYNTGVYNNAYNLSGVNHLNATIINGNNLTTKTISFYYNIPIGNDLTNNGVFEWNRDFFFFKQDVNNWQVYLFNGSRRLRFNSITAPKADGMWHNRVLVLYWDNTYNPRAVNVYEDGWLINNISSSDYNDVTLGGTGYIYIGRSPNPSSKMFNGSIDEVLIWNRSLSSEEIKSLYEKNTEFISTDAYLLKGQDVNPISNSTYSLGSSTLEWLKGWFTDLFVSRNLDVGTNVTIGGNMTMPKLANCDTIDTDSTGMFKCGNDATGGSFDNTNVAYFNNSNTWSLTQTFKDILGQQIYGVYNWTVSSGWLGFDGDTLTFDANNELNITILDIAKTVDTNWTMINTNNAYYNNTILWESNNSFRQNVTFNEGINLTSGKYIDLASGTANSRISYNGTCTIISGATSKMEIC